MLSDCILQSGTVLSLCRAGTQSEVTRALELSLPELQLPCWYNGDLWSHLARWL